MLEIIPGKENNVKEINKAERIGVSETENKNLDPVEVSHKEISESVYYETIAHVIKEFGDCFSDKQLIRIKQLKETKKPTVMSVKEYASRFPETPPTVIGHYDISGRIFLKDDSPEIIRHSTTHEVFHLTSFKEKTDTSDGTVYRSGIRETVIGSDESKNRALNEGITELYSIREMLHRGDTLGIKSVTAYSEATRKAYELQGFLGNRVVREAYFGGNLEALKAEFNRLNFGEETAWDSYSQNVDILEYGTDESEIKSARTQLTVQNAIMKSYIRSHPGKV